MRLRAFIGSSSKSLNVSNAIKHNLGDELDCVVWKDGFFPLSRTTLETLVKKVDEFDLGIFVFGQDDIVSSGGPILSVTRDNVIYEFGLFCGRLGPHRTFVVRPVNKSVRWPSDLDGFTAAQYDDTLAATNADRAVEDACKQIRSALDQFVPRPGVYTTQARVQLGCDWWTYGAAESSTAANEEGVQLTTQENIGLMYPHFDNLDAHGRFCAIRLMAIPNSQSRRVYVSVRAETEKVLLALSDSHAAEGWGQPGNEFMIRLPHLPENNYRAIVVDLEKLKPYMGNILHVNGFRIRAGVRVSHLCVFDDRPRWLTGADCIFPTDAPFITIEQPLANAVVDREHVVEGTISIRSQAVKSKDLQVFVHSPDDFWYPQGPLTIVNGRWQVKAHFGNEMHGAGSEFSIGVVTTAGMPAKERLRDLPAALGRSIVRVTRHK
jgi:hypothetical protein